MMFAEMFFLKIDLPMGFVPSRLIWNLLFMLKDSGEWLNVFILCIWAT